MEIRRLSNLPDPPCGFALWKATPEDPGQRVCITYHEGVQVAEIVDGEDAGEVVPLAAMGGTFEAEPWRTAT